VHANDDFARRVFERERRGYWSAALPLVLEKHGYLELTVADDPAVLLDPATWDRYDVVLVARLPDEAWSAEVVAAASAARGGVIVEGPPPRALLEALDWTAEPCSEEGAVVVRDRDLERRARGFGLGVGGVVEHSRPRAVRRREDLHWTAADVPIDDAQATAWRAPGWDAARLVVSPETAVAADWTSGGATTPAIARRGSLTVLSLSLFAYLGRRHTSEPFEGAQHLVAPRTGGLEAMLLALVDQAYQRAGTTRCRVLPWAGEARWALNVRHDFDRPLGAERARRLVEGHARAGTIATWYWRSRHADDPALEVVVESGRHEVALHSELFWADPGSERRDLERVLARPVVGNSAHGTANGFRYQGAPNVLWAEREGLLYTELLQSHHSHPHRFASLARDGVVRPLDVICLPHHESFDLGDRSPNVERVSVAPAEWAAAGGFLQLMSHPDLNTDELLDALAGMPAEGCLRLSAEDAARWWARTHVLGTTRLERADDGSVALVGRQPVRDVAVESRHPDGRIETRVVAEAGGSAAPVSAHRPTTANGAPAPEWDRATGVFAATVRRYHESRDVPARSVEATIRTNTDLVPARGDRLIGLLDGVSPAGLNGGRLVEVGSGFGALATYLALAGRARSVVATDLRADLVEAATDAATELGLEDRLKFQVDDMRELTGVGSASADVLVANNSFIYLTSKGDMDRALSAFHRVLAPGGWLVVYHANKWRLREPFSKDPLMHLLPRPIADAVGRATGWRHNRGRVRLLSPLELRRRARAVGFTGGRIVGFGPGASATGPRRHLGQFYGFAARRDER
jgi:SAM-dependent methyltransferase